MSRLVDPAALLYYWPYARFGINFHPPLAGQLNLATHALFGGWVKDIPSRRIASVLEYSLTIAIGFSFLARRYGAWAGVMTAGSLLLMPRVYGDGHIAATDTPGLLLWAATSIAFWKGLYEPGAPALAGPGRDPAWAGVPRKDGGCGGSPAARSLADRRPFPKSFSRRAGWADWVDGGVTLLAMLLPLGLAFGEILRLKAHLDPPGRTNLFVVKARSELPGAILAVPLLVWVVRRAAGRLRPKHPVWGVERPALEVMTAILAFAPVIGWLGNPAWWRETLPRLAHYYMLNTDRRGSLPDIQIFTSARPTSTASPGTTAGS